MDWYNGNYDDLGDSDDLDNLVEVEVLIKRVLDKSVLVMDENLEDHFLPLSQIVEGIDESMVGKRMVLCIPDWLADEKGLEYL